MYSGWDASAWVFVTPANGSGDFVVMMDVTDELVAQVVHRMKDATGDHLTLQLGEADFDLVKPAGISGRKMQREVGMGAEESFHQSGFMSRKVIGDDMDGLGGRLGGHHLTKKSHKLGAGVTRGSLTNDLAAASLQGRIKRKGAMAIVLKAVALGPSGGKRQHGIAPVEGLDGAFFVHAKHCCMGGRLEIKPNDIGRFGLKARIVAGHVTAHGMRLQAGRAPGAGNSRVGDAQAPGQPARAPVSGAIAGRFGCGSHNPGLHRRGKLVDLAPVVA